MSHHTSYSPQVGECMCIHQENGAGLQADIQHIQILLLWKLVLPPHQWWISFTFYLFVHGSCGLILKMCPCGSFQVTFLACCECSVTHKTCGALVNHSTDGAGDAVLSLRGRIRVTHRSDGFVLQRGRLAAHHKRWTHKQIVCSCLPSLVVTFCWFYMLLIRQGSGFVFSPWHCRLYLER